MASALEILCGQAYGAQQCQKLGLKLKLLLIIDFVNSLNTISTLYQIPLGFGAAASTRVSNELGAGNPEGARVAVFAVMSLQSWRLQL
ncbi:hypothetical protein CsSME_00022506 [Camellia sinensis var. sinensis]